MHKKIPENWGNSLKNILIKNGFTCHEVLGMKSCDLQKFPIFNQLVFSPVWMTVPNSIPGCANSLQFFVFILSAFKSCFNSFFSFTTTAAGQGTSSFQKSSGCIVKGGDLRNTFLWSPYFSSLLSYGAPVRRPSQFRLLCCLLGWVSWELPTIPSKTQTESDGAPLWYWRIRARACTHTCNSNPKFKALQVQDSTSRRQNKALCNSIPQLCVN